MFGPESGLNEWNRQKIPKIQRRSFIAFSTKLREATGQGRRETIDAIVIHEEWNRILRLGCGRVLKSLPGHSNFRDDLLQETSCHLFSALIRDSLSIGTKVSIDLWHGCEKVIYHAAIYASHRPHPISLVRLVLMDTEELDSLVLKIEPRVSRDDLLTAISRLKTEKTQRVMRHWALGMSLAESARKTGFAIPTVWEIRQR